MKHIEDAIFGFLNNKNLKVLAITGDWGVGKTHFWKNNIFNNIPIEDKKEYYSYVSLFNIETINDLKIKLYYESKPMLKEDSDIPQLSYTDTVYKSIEAIQKLQKIKINNYLICFDDIERKSDKLDLKTFLGYVSELKELYNKIVIIFNEDKINNKEEKTIISEYREKIIDIDLKLIPTIKNNYEYIFNDKYFDKNILASHQKYIFKIIEKTDTLNIRALLFISYNLKEIFDKIESISQQISKKTVENIIHISILLTLIKFKALKEIDIELDELKDVFNIFSTKSNDYQKIRTKLNIYYDLHIFHDYFNHIIDFLIHGYISNSSNFISEITTFDRIFRGNTILEELRNINTLMYSNFNKNETEIEAFIKNIISDNIDKISFSNLLQSIDLLIKLEKQNTIDKFLLYYIEKYSEKIDPAYYININKITENSDIFTLLENIKQKSKKNISDIEFCSFFMKKILDVDNITNEDVLRANALTENIIESWIMNSQEESFLSGLRALIYMNFQEEYIKVFKEKIKNVLDKIKSQNKLNEMRVNYILSFSKK